MGGFSGATGLAAYREEEEEDDDDEEELFETSSSVSGDSDSDDDADRQLSDVLEGAGALPEHRFAPQQRPVRRLNSDGLYDVSPMMMAQLPVKKGLSKYYDGKSQSFACMSEVRCLDDLRKKETPYKKMKPSRSYVALGGGQERHMPGPNSRAPAGSSCANLVARNTSKNMLYRPPPIPVNRSRYHQ